MESGGRWVRNGVVAALVAACGAGGAVALAAPSAVPPAPTWRVVSAAGGSQALAAPVAGDGRLLTLAPGMALAGVVHGPGALAVRLRARTCGRPTSIQVRIDGLRASSQRLTSAFRWRAVKIGAGRHTVDVRFTRRSSDAGAARAHRCTRAVRVDGVRLTPPAGAGGTTTETTTPGLTTQPPANTTTDPVVGAIQHVVWVMMENKAYGQVVGSPSAPYLNGLIAHYGLAASFYGETHPSLGNYIAATSGSTQGITDDNSPASHPLAVPNLFGQVAHRTYAESMPAPCNKADSGLYTPRHNPETYFTNLPDCARDNVPLGPSPTFEQPFTLIVPNLCSDMHSCPSTPTIPQQVAAGDAFLSGFVPKVLASPEYQAGTLALFIAFDEDDYASAQHTVAVVVSPRTPAGTVSATRFDHYSLLRATEELLGLPLLDGAATAPSMRSAFGL